MSIEKQGTIEGFKTTRNGKPMVVIDGQNYFLGKTQLTANIGDRISFEAQAFGERGDLWGINKWGKLPSNGTAGTVSSPPHPSPRPTVSDEAVLRFVSNCVGSAIGAKTITEPEQIEKWLAGARAAYQSQFGGS